MQYNINITTNRGKRNLDKDTSNRATKRLKAFLARREAEIYTLIAQRIYELEEEAKDAAFITIGGTVDITIPMGYDKAVNHPVHGPAQKEAINNKKEALMANNTWIEEKAPKGANLVLTKWVFALKTNPNSSLERYKARLITRGFSQIYNKDYDQTFALTIRTNTLRTFLTIIVANNLKCRQYNIKNVFTKSSLKERIYLTPLKGIHITPSMQLRVLRSLYRLKQSARDQNQLCNSELKRLGFKQSLANPCLFTYPNKGIILLVYIDNITTTAKDNSSLSQFYNNF